MNSPSSKQCCGI